jgi:hypothetical protein
VEVQVVPDPHDWTTVPLSTIWSQYGVGPTSMLDVAVRVKA